MKGPETMPIIRLCIPQQTPTVFTIYNDRPNKAQGTKDDNAAGEKAAV